MENALKEQTASAVDFHSGPLCHLSQYPEWSLLLKAYRADCRKSLPDFFLEHPTRENEFCVDEAGIFFDYSMQSISKKTLSLLVATASQHNMNACIDDLFKGRLVNQTESRPALHTALRSPLEEVILVNDSPIHLEVHRVLEQMSQIAERLRAHEWFGHSGLPIKDVVHVGIGGSYLGPQFGMDALLSWQQTDLSFHFIPDCDPDSFGDVVQHLNPATTLFIVASKSFTTQETLLNLTKAIHWLSVADYGQHVIAITANGALAAEYKINHVLPIWEWVGGRFSFFSAVNLVLMIAIGPSSFQELLRGARTMDRHFKTAPIQQNMPVLLALLGIWNINFYHVNNHLLLLYSKRLNYFVPYLQQLEMESNGKSTNLEGQSVNYHTGPIVWGGLGNHAEHAFYQALYQGSHAVAADVIFIGEERFHTMNQSAYKKIHALAFGAIRAGANTFSAGLNRLTLSALNPFTLGALVALYEHKVYCQSVIWGINPFDQPGIEAAKRYTVSA